MKPGRIHCGRNSPEGGECSSMKNVGILKYSLTVGSLLEILTDRRSQAFSKLIDFHSVAYVIGESISSIRMWNIVSQ